MPFRLPLEAEWEKAARGEDGRAYPWGEDFDAEKCDTTESGLGLRSPVTQFANGVSPFGCYDMAGNVWEWTDSWYEDKNTKVLRGGSWNSDQDDARCATRGGLEPESRYYNIGFRCVRTLK